jgi:hypothetical protein
MVAFPCDVITILQYYYEWFLGEGIEETLEKIQKCIQLG